MGGIQAQARGKPTELVALTMTEERKKEIDEICDNLDKMQKLKNKLLKTRQQFNGIVNITYDSEFTRLLKSGNDNFAFAIKNPGYLGKDLLMKKLFV